MSLWGAAPLLAAVLLGGGVHSNVHAVSLAASPVVDVGTATWESTVQLSNGGRHCPPKSDFMLDTTSPGGLIPARSATPRAPSPARPSRSDGARVPTRPAGGAVMNVCDHNPMALGVIIAMWPTRRQHSRDHRPRP